MKQRRILQQVHIAQHEANYTLYEPDSAGSMRLEVIDNNRKSTIEFRNVGDLNADSVIQIGIQEYNKRTYRTKVASFSVPAAMVETFLKHLNTPLK